MLSAILYFSIYCDLVFSDIAIGVAKLFGLDLMENFKFPYFSKNIGEFWKRWHISLTTWFRDYLYIPIGGSKGSLFLTIRNISIVFLVSGLWHGANWTFLFWGIVHVLAYIIFFLIKIKNKNRGLRNRLYTLLGAISTLFLLCYLGYSLEVNNNRFISIFNETFSFQKNNE